MPTATLITAIYGYSDVPRLPLFRLNARLIVYCEISQGEKLRALNSSPYFTMIARACNTLPLDSKERKRYLLAQCLASNPYRSEYLFWVDPEYLASHHSFPLEVPWPEETKLQRLKDRVVSTESLSFFGGSVAALNASLFNGEAVAREASLSSNSSNLLYDLAKNTACDLPYPVLSKLRVYSVCTSGIEEERLLPFISSCQRLGYDYTLLARDSQWQGWSWRTKIYLQALKSIPKPEIAIICDCTDLFFLGSAEECYSTFKSNKSKVLISAEENAAYPGKKYSALSMQDFFLRSLPEKGWAYNPNGGFLIGEVDSLIRVLEANQDSTDDQAGYCEMFYEGRANELEIDVQGQFCATFPNIPSSLMIRERWALDSPKFRLRHRESGVTPIAAHFPGQNYRLMQYMYGLSEAGGGEVESQPPSNDVTSSTSGSWVLGAVLLILLVVLIVAVIVTAVV